jgi:type II secretory pathway pseudopilin PulG
MVVMSIISLLSSIVLATLSTARDKAREQAVRAQLKQLITAAEIYRLNTPDDRYGTTYDAGPCLTVYTVNGSLFYRNSGLFELIEGLRSATGADPVCAAQPGPAANGNAASWAISVTSPNAGRSFCADYTGQVFDDAVAVGTSDLFIFPAPVAYCQSTLVGGELEIVP